MEDVKMRDEKINGKLLAFEMVIAFLLARESARSGEKLDDMHSALVNQAIRTIEEFVRTNEIEGLDTQSAGALLETVSTSELDALYGLASSMRNWT